MAIFVLGWATLASASVLANAAAVRDEASDALRLRRSGAPPPPAGPLPCGCGDNTLDDVTDRPNTIRFRINPGVATGLTLQGGKGGSRNDDITAAGCAQPTVRCMNNKDRSESFLDSVTVDFGSSIRTQPAGNTEMRCVVNCGTQRQIIDVHTSCSQDLFLGQVFGALTISNFPEYPSCSPPPAPPAPPGRDTVAHPVAHAIADAVFHPVGNAITDAVSQAVAHTIARTIPYAVANFGT